MELNKKHHWLLAGTVIHQNDEERMPVNFNTLLLTDKKFVTRKDLEIGQQALQIRFRREVPIQNPNIVDVFVISINHLGHMTAGEFNAGFAALADEVAAGETPK